MNEYTAKGVKQLETLNVPTTYLVQISSLEIALSLADQFDLMVTWPMGLYPPNWCQNF